MPSENPGTFTATQSVKAQVGLGAWLASWLRTGGWRNPTARIKAAPRLSVVERIPLAPRHQLALVEADGERILVALNPEGTPAFYPLTQSKFTSRAAASARRISSC